MEMTCGFKTMLFLPVMILQEAARIMKMVSHKKLVLTKVAFFRKNLQFDADNSDKFPI